MVGLSLHVSIPGSRVSNGRFLTTPVQARAAAAASASNSLKITTICDRVLKGWVSDIISLLPEGYTRDCRCRWKLGITSHVVGRTSRCRLLKLETRLSGCFRCRCSRLSSTCTQFNQLWVKGKFVWGDAAVLPNRDQFCPISELLENAEICWQQNTGDDHSPDSRCCPYYTNANSPIHPREKLSMRSTLHGDCF